MKIQRKTVIGFLLLLGSAINCTPFFLSVKAAEPMQNAIETVNLQDCIFLGESTTAHLKARGGLPDKKETKQVWCNRSGTLKLDGNLSQKIISEPISGTEMPISEAIGTVKPKILVLSFGLNGITGFCKSENRYLTPYRAFLDCIRKQSPATEILLQTVYPVSEHPEEWHFLESPEEINQKIKTLNQWIRKLENEEEGIFVIDTASDLGNEKGFLAEEFTTDGIHISEKGYEIILNRLTGFQVKNKEYLK